MTHTVYILFYWQLDRTLAFFEKNIHGALLLNHIIIFV